jgi:hypothetical protein
MKTYLPSRVAIECIDDAVVLSKRHFWPLLRLSVIPLLLYSATVYTTYLWHMPYWARLLFGLLWYATFGFVEAVSVVGAWELLHGRNLDALAVWRRVFRRFFTVLFAAWIRIYLILLGIVALIAPGLYFLAIYFAVPTVIVIEDLGLWASLKRSRSLALGSIWGILLSIGVAWIIVVLVAFFIPRGLTQLGVSYSSPLRLLLSIGWAAVVVPFRSALSARVYLEIRTRKEGYDLQHLMGSLTDALPPAAALGSIR